MFRFSIRDLFSLTLVAGVALAWWVDHQAQAVKVDYYMDQHRQWRERVEGMDDMLTSMGFKIEETWNRKSYALPPVLLAELRKSGRWPAEE
jgi:hypothetical protein